jgi:hypothetical protein
MARLLINKPPQKTTPGRGWSGGVSYALGELSFEFAELFGLQAFSAKLPGAFKIVRIEICQIAYRCWF